MLWILIDFNAYPDPAFYFNADPDPSPLSQTSADPNLDLRQTLKSQKFNFFMKNIFKLGKITYQPRYLNFFVGLKNRRVPKLVSFRCSCC